MSPIEKAAEKLRTRRRSVDLQYDRRVNPELAKLGTSWLLLVCGFDHEPPAVEKVVVCSNSLLIVRRDGEIDTITFTHDTRFPEQEIEEKVLSKENSARRSDAMWLRRVNDSSGLRVLREGYQNATGLPVDFIIIIQSDLAIKEFVDKIFGRLKVDIPIGFTAHPIYLDEDTKLPQREYRSGIQEMDGTSALQYMKAVPVALSYPPELENNERKHTIFRAIFNAIDEQKLNPLFWPPFLFKLNDLVQCQISSNNIVVDFDIRQLIVNNLSAVGEETKNLVLSGNPLRLGTPGFGKARYYVDPNSGVYPQSPIQWGTSTNDDPYAKRDIEELKIYRDYYVEVPRNGNALDPDLVNGYWKPVRRDVQNFLLGQ
jgi:anionic cell wall polymer biosynthesis LytR-Cps2A-Psr (LCP) family protein